MHIMETNEVSFGRISLTDHQRANIQKLIENLRSGEFSHRHYSLIDKNDPSCRCVLGVALASTEYRMVDWGEEDVGYEEYYPMISDEVAVEAGIDIDNLDYAVDVFHLNDDGIRDESSRHEVNQKKLPSALGYGEFWDYHLNQQVSFRIRSENDNGVGFEQMADRLERFLESLNVDDLRGRIRGGES